MGRERTNCAYLPNSETNRNGQNPSCRANFVFIFAMGDMVEKFDVQSLKVQNIKQINKYRNNKIIFEKNKIIVIYYLLFMYASVKMDGWDNLVVL